MKHKHADLIHAWADGAEIEYYSTLDMEWHEAPKPSWHIDWKYRIKPEEKKPVVRWLWAYRNGAGQWCTTSAFLSELDEACDPELWVKLEWSRTEFPE